MNRKFETIVTVAFICISAPAFAHGGGVTSHAGDRSSVTQNDKRTPNTSNTTTRTPRQLREIMQLKTERNHLIELQTKASLANNQAALKRLQAQIQRLDRVFKQKFGIVFG